MSMQDDAVAVHQAAVLAADVALYQAGVASVPVSPVDQAAIDAAVAAARADDVAQMQPQIDDAKAKLAALQADDDQKSALLKSIDAILHPSA